MVRQGVVTPEVHQWIVGPGSPGGQSNPFVPNDWKVCQKTGRVKPRRSHYDNVSCRLVLNMDHFCPWVGNTIGFHNRKALHA